MPLVTEPQTVLVTGANGFVAAHVIKVLLSRGFRVIGTVRTPAKGKHLEEVFEKEAGVKFQYVVVEDMQVPGAFDEVVKGVSAIQHIASPMMFTEGDPELVIRPAVKGTTGILESFKKNGLAVARVVITSSLAAVGAEDAGNLTSADWNQASVTEVNAKGANASPKAKYDASKVLAELAAWEFNAKNKGTVDFDIVTVCPPWIFGPKIQDDGLSGTSQYLLYNLRPQNRKTGEEVFAQFGSYNDVRDIASILVDLQVEPAAGGKRFITTTGPWSWKDVYEVLDIPFEAPPQGLPPLRAPDNGPLITVLRKSQSEIFRPFRETIDDAVESVWVRGSNY